MKLVLPWRSVHVIPLLCTQMSDQKQKNTLELKPCVGLGPTSFLAQMNHDVHVVSKGRPFMSVRSRKRGQEAAYAHDRYIEAKRSGARQTRVLCGCPKLVPVKKSGATTVASGAGAPLWLCALGRPRRPPFKSISHTLALISTSAPFPEPRVHRDPLTSHRRPVLSPQLRAQGWRPDAIMVPR